MDDTQRRTGIPGTLVGVSFLWLLLFVASCVFADELNEALFLLSGLWWLALVGAGLVLAGWSVVLLVRSRTWPALLPGAVVGGCIASLLLGGAGWSRPLRFQLARPGYEAQLARILAAPAAERQRVAGKDCHLDPGPPLRVAFIQPGSLLDNYTAVVYDPTGLVLQANQFRPDWSNWNDPRLLPVKKLFGGDLVWAEHLQGPWYRCGFT